ncbi:MAG TPA: DUF1318 domain-containing protein [Pseudomonadales bacterium]|nr:DUF1318 domain-containing protein [Pseudomonadales bacterium]MDP6315599.1 DUF1318 domain-containing protein [Pseudomonadales bacterium]MDP7316040.1 DUF1318 domain-containing protein [Pseudomonadales bacterium]HJL60613.1 DUF1318 domain-containing protein [Pseudomonadales bacterium]HJP52258.1 DUF1318 domain-containing protein [Pseudomonadales bacterium]
MRKLATSAMLLIAIISMPLQASPLDDARNSGQVVELANGYVKAKGDVPANIRSLVADVNKRRKTAYTKIAKRNGISVDQVAAESYVKRKKKTKRM